jgi:hypothetical protein
MKIVVSHHSQPDEKLTLCNLGTQYLMAWSTIYLASGFIGNEKSWLCFQPILLITDKMKLP